MKPLLILLVLAGCTTAPPVEVKIPVKVACLDHPVKRPDYLVTTDELDTMNRYRKTLELKAYHLTAQGYIKELEAAQLACLSTP